MAVTNANDGPRISMSMKILPSQRDLIDHAAALSGKNRTEFMLESALRAAREAVLDRTFFQLGTEDFAAFEKALAAPVDETRVRDLLGRPAPWD